MPDFTAQITTPADNLPFADVFNTPARLNPIPGVDPRYVKVGAAASSIQAKATVGGTLAPMDAALGGRLFQWWWVQWPGYPAAPVDGYPPIVLSAGQSSIATVNNFPNNVVSWRGLWILECWREGGGGMLLPFNVET